MSSHTNFARSLRGLALGAAALLGGCAVYPASPTYPSYAYASPGYAYSSPNYVYAAPPVVGVYAGGGYGGGWSHESDGWHR
jgi:hypothetical protein